MQRFFFSEFPFDKNITITEDAFVHQIGRVLRSDIGENIILFNGDGWEYIYSIQSITKKYIEVSLERKYENNDDKKTKIYLYQAIPNKYEKIEYILQKGAETGIDGFIFFRAERSQKLIINEKKIIRFQEILREATEQCGGNRVPSLQFVTENIPTPKDGLSYFFHTKDSGSINLNSISPTLEACNIFVGPEGGWSDREVAIFQEMHMQHLYLGQRILRTETVGPVVSFFLTHQ